MRILLGSIFAVLTALSVTAWVLKPAPPTDGKTPIAWVSDNNPERQRQIDTFNRLFPGLRLWLDASNSGLQKIIIQSSSGVGPDVCDAYGGSQLQTLVESGIAWDVTDQAKEMGFSMTEKIWPSAVGEVSYNGRQYGYPCNVNVDVLIYNKNVFDRFDVPYPKAVMTWDEFIDLARRLTEISGSDKVYGTLGPTYSILFASQRGEFFSEDGTRLEIREAPMRNAFQLRQDMIFKHRITPTMLEIKSMASQGGWGSGSASIMGGLNLFGEGRFAMVPVGKWALISFRRAHADQLKRRQSAGDSANAPNLLRLGATLIPHFKDMPPFYGVGARTAVINARSPYRDQALNFLKYLASADYCGSINRGVDALPGNPEHARLGLEPGVPEFSEVEIHETTIAAMEYGYRPRFSPFLLTSDVERVLRGQADRLEASPGFDVDQSLQDAEDELLRLMQRNLNRSPELRERYRALTGTDNVVEANRRPR